MNESSKIINHSELGYLYRYDITVYASSVDEYDNMILGTNRIALNLDAYPIIKRTLKGAWISPNYYDKRFVNLTAKKKYACETELEAAYSFLARKNRQIRILESQLKIAKDSKQIITKLLEELCPKATPIN